MNARDARGFTVLHWAAHQAIFLKLFWVLVVWVCNTYLDLFRIIQIWFFSLWKDKTITYNLQQIHVKAQEGSCFSICFAIICMYLGTLSLSTMFCQRFEGLAVSQFPVTQAARSSARWLATLLLTFCRIRWGRLPPRRSVNSHAQTNRTKQYTKPTMNKVMTPIKPANSKIHTTNQNHDRNTPNQRRSKITQTHKPTPINGFKSNNPKTNTQTLRKSPPPKKKHKAR